MWSVFSESLEVYLGQSLTLVRQQAPHAAFARRRYEKTIVLRHAPTLPLARVLQNLEQQISGRHHLRITLSGARCPAIDVPIPQGVTHLSELKAVVSAGAAQNLGTTPEDVVCSFDPRAPELAAAVPVALMQEILDWALRCKLPVTSIQPLWALAAASKASRRRTVKGLFLYEDDALTWIAQQGDERFTATTTAAMLDPEEVQTQHRRWLISVGLKSDEVLSLKFAADPDRQEPGTEEVATLGDPTAPHLPTRWAGHWSCL